MTTPDFTLAISDEVFPTAEMPSAIQPIPDSIAASSLGSTRPATWSKGVSDVAFLSAVVIPVTTAIGASAALFFGTRSSRGLARGLLAGSAVWGIGMGLFRWQAQRLFTGQPVYKVARRVGVLEIRKYPPMVVAETTAFGTSWRSGLAESFTRLFRFIQNENADGEAIGMTTPVTMRKDRDEGFPLGTPASVRGIHDTTRACTVGFIMPTGRAATAWPTPLDARVRLVTYPARKVAVLRFRESVLDEAVTRRRAHELIARVETLGLTTRGEPTFAGYDPPTTLSPFRRQEAWIELD